MKKKFNAVGCDIFAGGFTLGMNDYFNILGHIEHTTYGHNVMHENFTDIPIKDITNPEKIKGKVHVIYGNPPCAIWSAAAGAKNKGESWKSDPRLDFIRDNFELLVQYRPNFWAWESVTRAFTRGRDFIDAELVSRAEELGYSTTYLLVDAKYLNTPQVRKRFFLVFHNLEFEPCVEFSSPMTVREALADLYVPREELAAARKRVKNNPHLEWLLKNTKPGEHLAGTYDKLIKRPAINERGQKVGRPSFLETRARYDQPAPTIIGDKLWHPTQARRLTDTERACLCGYPEDWVWPKETKSETSNFIARGVCPTVGGWLGAQFLAALTKNKRLRKPRRQVVDLRKPDAKSYQVI